MRNTYKALFIAMVIGLFILRPVFSYADWNGHDGHDGHTQGQGNSHGHDGGHGHSYVGVDISLSPDTYFYGGPYYPPVDNVLVAPPVYQPVVVNGATYYLNNGTYYMYNGYSYQPVAPQVFEQPVTEVQPQEVITPAAPVAITTAASDEGSADSFTINIPNNKGGYTAVTLKKSGSGFIGPQGEFYPEFPKVSQLIVIYGK